LAIIFGLVPWGFAMPVAYKWPLWFIAMASIVYLCLTTIPWLSVTFPAWPQKVGWIVVVLVICAEIFWPVMHRQWKVEKATVVEGNLRTLSRAMMPVGRTLSVGKANFTFSGTAEQNPGLQFLYDSGFRISVAQNNDLQISTPIRDRFGRLVANIDNNHWTITSACLDKNYTQDSLEILDDRGLVVFQVTILSDRVQIQGEWRDEFGHGLRLSIDPKSGGLSVVSWDTPEHEQQAMQIIGPMFVYPSINHWGEKKMSGP
jgi:hypothetical protein